MFNILEEGVQCTKSNICENQYFFYISISKLAVGPTDFPIQSAYLIKTDNLFISYTCTCRLMHCDDILWYTLPVHVPVFSHRVQMCAKFRAIVECNMISQRSKLRMQAHIHIQLIPLTLI